MSAQYDRTDKDRITKPFFCSTCKKGFTSPSALSDHDRDKHPEIDELEEDAGIAGITDDIMMGGQE